MTRNDFIQRLVIRECGLYSMMERLVEFASEAADKLEECGVPFDEEPKVVDADFEEIYDVRHKPLKEFYEEGKISCRTFNVLKAAGAQTLGDVTKLTLLHLLKVRSCGKKTIADAENLLHSYGYDWAKEC